MVSILPIIFIIAFFIIIGLIIWFARKAAKSIPKSRALQKLSERELRRRI